MPLNRYFLNIRSFWCKGVTVSVWCMHVSVLVSNMRTHMWSQQRICVPLSLYDLLLQTGSLTEAEGCHLN